MDPTPIRIAALQQGRSQKDLAQQTGITPRRWYRLIEDLAVPAEEELFRISNVTGLPIPVVRRALPSSPAGRSGR